MRQYYLVQEFSHVIVVIVKISPSAVEASMSGIINTVITGLQTQHSGALLMISGDFNHVSLSLVLTNFIQYVDCAMKENKILDLFYVDVKGAYSSSSLYRLIESHHNLIHQQQQVASTRTVKI